jgi:hypothetical protein
MINKSSAISTEMPIGMWRYNGDPLTIIKELILARRGNTVVALLAAGLLCVFAYRSLTRVPAPPAATTATCTAAAIRAVGDPMERAILSGRCGKRAPPVS